MRNVKIGTHNAVKRFKTVKNWMQRKNNNFTVVCLFAIIIEH